MWNKSLVLVALVVFFGCGQRTGEVSGVATFEGKPVPGGLLTFRHADPSHNSIAIELPRDGTFKVELPVGDVSISIDNREFEPKPATLPALPPGMNLPPDVIKGMQASAKESSKVSDRWVKLPEKYYEMETSGLKIIVKGGKQEETIEFKK